MFKFNTQGIPDSRQCPIDGVKEVVATCIILRSDPFSFHYSPQGFCKIQVRGIRWKVKEKKSAFLPQFSHSFIFLFRCTLALSSTMNVSFFMFKEKVSRYSTTLSASILSVVVNP